VTPSLTLPQPPWRRTVDGSGGPCCSDPGLVSKTGDLIANPCPRPPSLPGRTGLAHTARTQLRQPFVGKLQALMSMRRRQCLHQSCPTGRLLLVTISLAAGRYRALTSASGDGPPSPCWTSARTGARSSPGSAPDSRLDREQAETNTSGTGDSPHVQADPSEGARPCMSNGASWWQQNRCRRKGKQAQRVKRPRSTHRLWPRS
jgi:hypothetical protein